MATTTPKVRAAIQASDEPASVLAERFGTTGQTVCKWRHRDTVHDRSHTPHRLQSEAEQKTICWIVFPLNADPGTGGGGGGDPAAHQEPDTPFALDGIETKVLGQHADRGARAFQRRDDIGVPSRMITYPLVALPFSWQDRL